MPSKCKPCTKKSTCLGVYTNNLHFLSFPTAEPYKALYFKNLWSPWKAFCWFQLDQVHVWTLGPCSLYQRSAVNLVSQLQLYLSFSLLMTKRSQDTEVKNWGCWKVSGPFKLESRVLFLSSLIKKNHIFFPSTEKNIRYFQIWGTTPFQSFSRISVVFCEQHFHQCVSLDCQRDMTSKLCTYAICTYVITFL